MKIELTKLEKVSLEALLEYELDTAGEELKNTPYNTYHVLKGILDKLYKIEEQEQERDYITVKGYVNAIKRKILTLAMTIVNEELGNTEDYNKGLSLYECNNTLCILRDKYRLNKEV